jgi:hypothetical protein
MRRLSAGPAGGGGDGEEAEDDDEDDPADGLPVEKGRRGLGAFRHGSGAWGRRGPSGRFATSVHTAVRRPRSIGFARRTRPLAFYTAFHAV